MIYSLRSGPDTRTLQASADTWERTRRAMVAAGHFQDAKTLASLLKHAPGNAAARRVTVPTELARVIFTCAGIRT